MSTLDEENLVSAEDVNYAIKEFIGKHPENVNIWVDGETTTIQISNIGVRDKLFPRLAYLVKNTSIKDGLQLFNMSAECAYVSDRIIRFTCTLVDLAYYSIERRWYHPRGGESALVEKFFSRLGRSNVLNSNAYDQALITAEDRLNK